MKKKTLSACINPFGEPVNLVINIERYSSNHRIAITAFTDKCEMWGVLSANVDDILEEDEIAVKTYSENASWVPQVLEQLKEYFVPTGRSIRSGFVSMPVYKVVSQP